MIARPPTHPNRPFRFTREQYYKLGELGFFDGKRVELIRGEIIEMSPINWPHVLGTSKVGDALRAAFAGIGSVIEQGPHPTDDSDPIPDVRVVTGQLKDYTDHPRTALLIVEVADTTLDYDTTTKAELYATANVPEYWVLDVVNRQLHVFRDPQPLPTTLGATAYQTHDTLGLNDTISPLAAPNAVIRVSDLLP
ncbi:MAG: Uma2 family endonuclease [Planctomycetia bacterium]|nr:Uma2 family endonuclease [Planctomycetia bacterium]